jgi:Fe-S oxidoreductase/nitrate reductase gamma subunit
MEATREIYWNVGHAAVLPMYLGAFIALGLFVWGFWTRSKVWRLGLPLDRFDRLPTRLWSMLKGMFGQTRVLRVIGPGGLHSVFFWSFGLLFIGTLLVMTQADLTAPLFGVTFLKGGVYEWFSLVLDLAGAAALLMLAGLLVRRFVIRPRGLDTIADDYIVHAFLMIIIITGFVIEGLRMAATEVVGNPSLARFSPIGLIFAGPFADLGPEGIATAHALLWWFHLVLVLGFIAIIPHTKLRHIFTTSANYFFADLGPKGGIVTLDLEDEKAEQFGVAKIKDLYWKDLFDADACTTCKRCQDRCPAFVTDKPLSPMKLVKRIGEVARTTPDAELCDDLTEEVLWACTTCRACQEICPASIEHVNKIIGLRRNLSLMAGAFPGDEVKTAIGDIEVNGNPFGLAFAGRGDWAQGLPVTVMGADPEMAKGVDLLYFAGCYASFDRRNQEVARAFVTICDAAGLKVGILGKEEKCCGEPARKLGNEYLYQAQAGENIEVIKRYGVKRVVTTCPHCYNTLARDYSDLGFDLPVEHYTTFVDGLLKAGRLELASGGSSFDVTYHDSCYLGRYMDIVEEPRAIVRRAGGRIVEMDKSRLEAFCCGGGGGRILAEERIGSRINVARVAQAEKTGASTLVSNCPFCLTMFEDGIKTGGAEGKLVAKDLAEIVASRIATKA